MPLPLVAAVGIGVIGFIIGGGASLGIGTEFITRAFERLRKKPTNPPPAPPARMQISRTRMVEDAQRKLKMDIVNDYNFAICGAQGAGKSYLVNTIRMLLPISDIDGEYGSAPIDCTESTQEAQRYRFPPNFYLPFVALWDLPGFDSEAFPTDTYFENPRITLYAFDCLILVVGERLKRSDLKLLEEAKQWNMPVILAVNQCDRSIEGEKRKQMAYKKRPLTEEEYRETIKITISRIKTRIQEQMNRSDEADIYCVSAHIERWAEELTPSTTTTVETSTASIDGKYDEEALRKSYFASQFIELCSRCTDFAIERRLQRR